MEMRVKTRKWFRKRSLRLLFIAFFIAFTFGHIFGLFIHPFEVDFNSNFSYPLDLKNFRDIIETIKDMKQTKDRQLFDINEEMIKSIPKPINEYNYRFIIRNDNKCSKSESIAGNRSDGQLVPKPLEDITLLIVVKSSLQDFDRRNAIRKSWGFEHRFSDVLIKRVFILGHCVDRSDIKDCQDVIDDEFDVHKDIVQSDFDDSYYNNTIKTMIGFKWAVEYCPTAQFILFVDDDYYISVKNLLKYLRKPLDSAVDSQLNSVFDGRLYTGYVFPNSSPLRHKTSKWFVSLEEYPYSLYPPYVTAGAFVLSNITLIDMYFSSLYTKHFRFDDIFVGILAKKLSIIPKHNQNFHFWSYSYEPNKYQNVIASHGFHDPKQLSICWNQQKSLGNA